MKVGNFEKEWGLLKMCPNLSYYDNAIRELEGYFNYDSSLTKFKFENSEKLLTDEWNSFFSINNLSCRNLEDFYDKTENEIFELMNWHFIRRNDGPYQYIFALDLAKKLNFKTYLDYGSGIGSGGILFALNDFVVTLADISSSNLKFCQYRFAIRNLNFAPVDLKADFPKGIYDVITCFDVLEHSIDPISILIKLKKLMAEDGILLINTHFYIDKDRPMHIVHNTKLNRKIRSLGFKYNWEAALQYKEQTSRSVFVLKKSKRNRLMNLFILLFDSLPESVLYIISRVYKSIKNA